MELKDIAELIDNKNYLEAKVRLIELIKKSHSYENIYFTLSQVCTQLNELENSKKYINYSDLLKNFKDKYSWIE